MKQFNYSYETYVDEIPPMSIEWMLREKGLHKLANSLPGPSWIDRFITRTQKRNVGLIPDDISHITCEKIGVRKIAWELRG